MTYFDYFATTVDISFAVILISVILGRVKLSLLMAAIALALTAFYCATSDAVRCVSLTVVITETEVTFAADQRCER